MNEEPKNYLTLNEFAKELSIHPNSVRNMIKRGRLSALKIGYGSKTSPYRIARSEINRLAEINLEIIVDKKVEEKLKNRKK